MILRNVASTTGATAPGAVASSGSGRTRTLRNRATLPGLWPCSANGPWSRNGPGSPPGRVIDLDLEAFDREPALLVRRMKVDPGVARRLRQRLHFELEVFEIPPRIEEVRPRPVRHNLPVANTPGVLMLAGPPPVQILPVEQRDPRLVRRQQRQRCQSAHKHPPRKFHRSSICPCRRRTAGRR